MTVEKIILNENGEKSVIFSGGYTGKFEDYMNILVPLSQDFRVVAYNYRGHCNSPGMFSIEGSIQDLERLLIEEKRSGFVGHSVGAALSLYVAENHPEITNGVYMINPVLDSSYCKGPFRMALYAAAHMPIIPYMLDKLLDYDPKRKTELLQKYFGVSIHNTHFIEGYGQLSHVHAPPYSGRVAFALSDHDEFLGTADKKRMHTLREKIRQNYPQGNDYSDLVKGLNHCLNSPREGDTPFLIGSKQEIIESVKEFFR